MWVSSYGLLASWMSTEANNIQIWMKRRVTSEQYERRMESPVNILGFIDANKGDWHMNMDAAYGPTWTVRTMHNVTSEHPGVIYQYEVHTCIWMMRNVSNEQDCESPLSCRELFTKEPLIIGPFCGKWPIEMRHRIVWSLGAYSSCHPIYNTRHHPTISTSHMNASCHSEPVMSQVAISCHMEWLW